MGGDLREVWSLGKITLALRLSGAQTQGAVSLGSSTRVHLLVGVRTRGKQELPGRAVAQQRRKEERRLSSRVLTVYLDN